MFFVKTFDLFAKGKNGDFHFRTKKKSTYMSGKQPKWIERVWME